MQWGRKFKAGLWLIVMWTMLLITKFLPAEVYALLVGAVTASLFAASVAGKFAGPK